MSGTTPLSDPELPAEQAYSTTRWSRSPPCANVPSSCSGIFSAPGNPDLDYKAALARRVTLLADSPRPLLFGRIDEVESGPTWHIGRRHVEDDHSDPVVVDWRAPVAVPFYRASAKDALGLARRRQIMVDRNSVIAVADDLFGDPGTQHRPRPDSAAATHSWPSSSGLAPARCSTLSPPSRPSRTRSSVRRSISS